MEKAIREGETGRVRRPISVARARSQGSQRRGKSLNSRVLATSGAETVSGADCVVGREVPTNRSPEWDTLLTGKLTGNFHKLQPRSAARSAIECASSDTYSQIPYAPEQGIGCA